jgi:hypothetical protein
MKSQFIILVTIFLSIFSCVSDKDDIQSNLMWIDSIRVNCYGVGEQTCYRIQENDHVDENKWSLFYDAIEGFDAQYETGYVYKISVTKIKIDNPPADGSSIKYVFNTVISKALDE